MSFFGSVNKAKHNINMSLGKTLAVENFLSIVFELGMWMMLTDSPPRFCF